MAHQVGRTPVTASILSLQAFRSSTTACAGQLRVVGVGVGVVHHLVPRVMESLDRFGVLIHPITHNKEGGF